MVSQSLSLLVQPDIRKSKNKQTKTKYLKHSWKLGSNLVRFHDHLLRIHSPISLQKIS